MRDLIYSCNSANIWKISVENILPEICNRLPPNSIDDATSKALRKTNFAAALILVKQLATNKPCITIHLSSGMKRH